MPENYPPSDQPPPPSYIYGSQHLLRMFGKPMQNFLLKVALCFFPVLITLIFLFALLNVFLYLEECTF